MLLDINRFGYIAWALFVGICLLYWIGDNLREIAREMKKRNA